MIKSGSFVCTSSYFKYSIVFNIY